ncbi:hypothetical protein PTTG_05709 [Puccinia triticina 1-1 BBBD Race 1]|uniref:Uncharacterized protein n=2 Tax=Puccinia triticina TaxID=208348 RepID=A0A180GHC9_PUCT1|nr:uncharacterized protein PtA15_3A381 [Puccinia triticina]OAV91373.1 hypothetical protein PTTG_05709 [Puccinia triticina 1-1 BBBD Race 1]WAQ83015.1 hypothetical protein PtA15_3A381 [Puccinia triticina]WAR53844.1 hypothetical protein PtB15_3B353 [Puccinia triticina]
MLPIIPTSDRSLSKILQESFGWCWPPFIYPQEPSDSCLAVLPPLVLRHFRRLNPGTQQQLLRFKDDRRNVANIEELEECYRRTWTIRRIFLETIDKLYLNESLETWSPQFWTDDNLSELSWLRLMDLLMMKEKKEPQEPDRKADYPVHINFTPCHPLQPNRPISTHRQVQVESIKHINMSDDSPRYWTIGFQDTIPKNPRFHDLCLKRTHPFPNIMISNHLDRLGHIWIDKLRDEDEQTDPPAKKCRVLFQKTCSDGDLGLFLWPQFNLKRIGKTLPGKLANFLTTDTPKIPIYQGGIVELCDQDRLILFTTQYRSHRVFIDLQIAIEFCWASEVDQVEARADFPEKNTKKKSVAPEKRSLWIDNLLQWPNPSERHSHYVKAPNSYPEFDIDDEEQDGIVISQTDEQESREQIAITKVKDQSNPMDADQDTSSDECLFMPEERANSLTECNDKDESIPISGTCCPLECPAQINCLGTDSSENPILRDSDSVSSPRRIKVLGEKHHHQDPQAIPLSDKKDHPGKPLPRRSKPASRHGKENDSTQKEARKVNAKGKSSSGNSNKSAKRKSPRLIEMAHSNQPTTSKRKRI